MKAKRRVYPCMLPRNKIVYHQNSKINYITKNKFLAWNIHHTISQYFVFLSLKLGNMDWIKVLAKQYPFTRSIVVQTSLSGRPSQIFSEWSKRAGRSSEPWLVKVSRSGPKNVSEKSQLCKWAELAIVRRISSLTFIFYFSLSVGVICQIYVGHKKNALPLLSSTGFCGSFCVDRSVAK